MNHVKLAKLMTSNQNLEVACNHYKEAITKL